MFGFIIGMAVANGQIAAMHMETDPENGGALNGRKGLLALLCDYRRMCPTGTMHIQALIAYLIAVGCAASLVAGVLWLSNARP